MADIFVLNAFGLTERTSVSAKGNVKKRFSVRIEAQPIVHNLDPKALGKGPAEAIAKLYRDRITGIGAMASAATVRARKAAAIALSKGEAWARSRYSGGRIGTMAPGQSDRLFNDSGRLARSIVAAPTEDAYVVNVAANRFDPRTLDNGGTSALQRIFDRLRDFLPELGDANLLMSAIPVRAAVQKASADMLKKLNEQASRATLELVERLFDTARDAGELGETAAEAG
jgi:hypothetical protein